MKFDHNILFEFLPEKDKKNFLVWDNAFKFSGHPYFFSAEKRRFGINIVAIYRAPFEERLIIPVALYNQRVKQKQREDKLSTIL